MDANEDPVESALRNLQAYLSTGPNADPKNKGIRQAFDEAHTLLGVKNDGLDGVHYDRWLPESQIVWNESESGSGCEQNNPPTCSTCANTSVRLQMWTRLYLYFTLHCTYNYHKSSISSRCEYLQLLYGADYARTHERFVLDRRQTLTGVRDKWR